MPAKSKNSARRLALTNGRIVLPREVVTGHAVVVENGKIAEIVKDDALRQRPDMEILDAGGRVIAPGLIDLHTHGALNHSFNEPTAEAFAAITGENLRRGVTSLLATLAAAPVADLAGCLEFCRNWMKQPHDGAQILGAHLESPYISMAQKGALDPASVRPPNDGTADALLKFSDVIKIFVLAPELPGAMELIARLHKAGIVPAAGHSSAKDAQVMEAMRFGLRHVTHIWSAMSSTIREGPWRKPGLLECALLLDGLSVEMIADNKHLPPTLMKLAYKCVGPDRLCVISDAGSGAGLPEGARFRMGGMEYDVHDGVGMLLDRTAFACSTTLLNGMIPVLTDVVGIPLPDAFRMLSLNPARVIGLESRKGSLEPGKDADIAIFNADWSAWKVMVGGKFCGNDE